MRKKILEIGAVALILGTLILSSISVQAIQQDNIEINTEDDIQDIISGSSLSRSPGKRYYITGSGRSCRFFLDGTKEGGRIEGDIKIIFSGGRYPLFKQPFCKLRVYDLETGKIYSSKCFPDPLYITDFSGYGYAFNEGWGMCVVYYCEYSLRGFASDVSIDETQSNDYNQQQNTPSQIQSSQQYSIILSQQNV